MLLSVVSLLVAGFLLIRYVTSISNKEVVKEQVPIEVTHRVLFICSHNPLYFTYASQVRGLEKSLYPKGIEYDVVYMDAKNYNTKNDVLVFHDFLKARLENRTDYEAVLLGDDNALQFALDYQDELFAGLPMVFFAINDIDLAQEAARNPYITGFYENTYLLQTIGLATRLFPAVTKLVALHDNSAAGIADTQVFADYIAEHPQYTLIDIDSSLMTQAELILALENIPSDALLFYMTCYTDNSGRLYSMYARTNTVVQHTHVPIFRNYVGGERMGVLGGIYMDFEDQCVMAGNTVAKVLAGQNIAEIPLNLQTPSRCAFDNRLVQKYGIDASLLPSNTFLYNQGYSFMRYYGRMLPIAILIVLALLSMVIAANLGSANMRLVAAELRTSHEELRASHDQLSESQELLRYQAEYDEVLDIMNRRAITEYMHNTLTAEDVYSVVVIDIDGFKELNESYGHQVADSILQYIVALLKSMGRDDGWQIARYGGDEFLLVIPNKCLTRDHKIVKEIMDSIRAPIPLGDEAIAITASMGISNSDGLTLPEQHIINAEAAMYEAKDRGHNGMSLYGDEMKEKVREENRIKAKLLDAFENDGFYMLYQPQVNAQTKEVSGFEALVRMKDKSVFPSQFIPIAEHNGWIWRIGRITTELVIKQLAAWRDAGHKLHPVSVNFSSNQLNDHGYIDFMKGLLERYDIPAHYLEIEITESLFLEKSALGDKLFTQFKEMGIRLLMDDFGTGYSSLGYLTYIPVDIIKLDKSLVDAYLKNGSKSAFIHDIIQLVHDLDKEMIIEGVEEEWQFNSLRDFGANTIQGYYFSKPISADEAIRFEPR